MRLYHIEGYLYDEFEWWNTDFRFYADTTLSFVLSEPTLTLRVGDGRWKGIFQFGLTVPTINAHSYVMVNTSSMLGIPLFKTSLGVSYAFGKKEAGLRKNKPSSG